MYRTTIYQLEKKLINYKTNFLIKPVAALMILWVTGSFAAVSVDEMLPSLLVNDVNPNIMLVVDDSWSMRWEVIYNEGTGKSDPTALADLRRMYLHFGADPDFSGTWGGSSTIGWLGAEARALCRGYNKLAYDPRVDYKPWDGWPMDSDTTISSTPFQSKTLNTALYYPYRPDNQRGGARSCNLNTSYSSFYPDPYCRLTCKNSTSCAKSSSYTCNLMGATSGCIWDIPTNIVQGAADDQDMTDHVYYHWKDMDGDGEYDANGLSSGDPDECGFYNSWGTKAHDWTEAEGYGKRQVTSLPPNKAAAVAAYPEHCNSAHPSFLGATADPSYCTNTQENYANWFTYYRRRLFVMYAAIAKIIKNTNANIGIYFIAGDSGSYSGKLISAPVDASTETGKKALMKALWSYAVGWGLDTPLRRGLHKGAQGLESAYNAGGCIACQHNVAFVLTDGVDNVGVSGIGNVDLAANAPFEDIYSNTLADVAYHWFNEDLNGSTNLQQLAPFGSRHPQDTRSNPKEPHIRTSILSFGLGVHGDFFSTSLPPGGGWDNPGSYDGKIEDMMHAALNGGGNYYSADSPDQVVAAVELAVKNLNASTRGLTSMTANSGRLDANNRIYLARFRTQEWTGEMESVALSLSGATVNQTSQWLASENIPAPGFRKILAGWGGQFVASNKGSTGLTDDEVNYLRGDTTNEGTLFRIRGSRVGENILGSIMNSSPVYVGMPDQAWDETSGLGSAVQNEYIAFKTNHTGRDGVIYVGANDGMLHGFLAASGAEVVAYVPSGVAGSRLRAYTQPAFEFNFQATVDGAISVGDYYDNGWKTLLIGGLRTGGNSVYALDVTDPAAQTREWEYSSVDMGQYGGEFLIVPVKTGGTHQWQVIFGNGYNSSAGTAKLIALNATTGNAISVVEADSAGDNGLAAPVGHDSDGDGLIDYVYAGDLKGRVWRFAWNGSGWGSTQLIYDAGSARPITTRLALAPAPVDYDNDGVHYDDGVMILLGTGKYQTAIDMSTTQSQAIYGLWDANFGNTTVLESDLVEQDISSEILLNGNLLRKSGQNPVQYLDNVTSSTIVKRGWFTVLRAPGDGLDNAAMYDSAERVIVSPQFFSADHYYKQGRLLLDTIVPKTTNTDPCVRKDYSFMMEVDPYTGGPLVYTGSGHSNGVFDITDDGLVNGNDLDASGTAYTGVARLTESGDSATAGSTLLLKLPDGKEFKVFSNGTTVSGKAEHNEPPEQVVPHRTSWRQLKL